MGNTTDIKEIQEKLEIEKEMLGAMPKKNEKNIEKYLEKIEELKNEFTDIHEQIGNVLNERYIKGLDIPGTEEDIENIELQIDAIDKELHLLNNVKTSFEKMELDQIIYKIGKYYKDNLDNINDQIGYAIKKFEEVGMTLESTNFNYSSYAQQYMEVFFEERRTGDINTNKLKAKFEEIYWKCPDIIVHIELSLRSTYLKNQSQIDKYFQKEKIQILRNWNKTEEEITRIYYDLKERKRKLEEENKKKLLLSFLSGTLDIKDYEEEKIQSNYSKILAPTVINGIEINQEKIEKGIRELLNSLNEYKNYTNFKFIIDDLKKHYEEKDKYSKIYEETLKKVLENEKKLMQINKKLYGKKGFFGKKKQEIKQSTEQNQIVEHLKKDYKDLEINKFLNKMASNLDENATIYDALKLASSYYNYLAVCIIENNKNITQEKIDEQVRKLKDFINSPYNNLINNLAVLDEKDIVMIIKDRYKLLDFNIKPDDFNARNMDNLIKILENILTSFNLKKVGLKVEYIKEMLEIKQALKI